MNRIDLEKQLIAKSSEDAAFRQQLIANPREALAASGITLPEGVEVTVFAESPTRLCLVLPAFANELTDTDLDGVAGGRDRSGQTMTRRDEKDTD